MRRLRGWLMRFAGLFDKGRREREFDEELESHLEMHIEDNLRLGMTPEEARRQALIRLGGIEPTKEAYRDQRGLPVLETLWRDVSYAARQLRRNPGFTAVAVVTLALGIGANTAIFSVVNAVLLKPLPYPAPDRLVHLLNDGRTVVGSGTFGEIRDQSQSLARVAAYSGRDMNLTGTGLAERLAAGAVTADFFPLLGVQPMLGRSFTREEDTPNGPQSVILGYGLWQSRFGGDPEVLGQTIALNQQSFTVVGILPAPFQFPEPFQLWIPLALREPGTGGGRLLVNAIARLKPGVSLDQAQAELRTIVQRERGGGGGGLTLIGLHEQVVGNARGALLVLLGAVAFVLLIACANVANLLLARAATRQREMAVRAALGAGRTRIVRQLLTESVLLSLLGGGLGLLLAAWGVRALDQWSDAGLPAMQEIGVDGWVLAFTLGVSVVTGLVFGVAPAFRAWQSNVNGSLKEEGRGDTGGYRNRLRNLLVVSEMALALMLLIGAGLLIKSFSRLLEVDPGFRPESVLTFDATLTGDRFASPPQKVDFVERVLERVRALPGVQMAAATDALPLAHFSEMTVAEVEGQPPIDWSRMTREEAARRTVSLATVSSDYFAVMGSPVRAGRAFSAQDARAGAGVVVVNEAFAKFHFPGQGAVGQRIRFGGRGSDTPWVRVVGVVSDVRQSGLASDVTPEAYRPQLEEVGGALSFVIRTAGEPAALAPSVRAALAEVDRNQPIHNLMTMEERLANTTSSRRLNTVLLGSFAAVALLLAAVGIYGVMSYAVTQRRREIGVRMALGAQKSSVLRLVIGNGLRLTGAGVGIGLLGAFALTRYLSSLLYAVNATDPETFLGLALALTVVALLACWLPARRAANVTPMDALRCG